MLLGFELSSTAEPTCELEAPLLEAETCFPVNEHDSGQVGWGLGDKGGAWMCSSSGPAMLGAIEAGGVEITDTEGWIGAGRVKVEIDEFRDNESGF